MNFTTFLHDALSSDFWKHNRLLHFTAPSYPHLFFQTLFDIVTKKNVLNIEFKKIHLPSIPYQELVALLSQTFLGMSVYYWLGDLSAMSNKDREKLLLFLKNYQGENYLAFFYTELSHYPGAETVTISNSIDETTLTPFMHLLGNNLPDVKIQLIKKYLTHVQQISLDTLCMLTDQVALTHVRDIHSVIKNLLLPTQPQASLSKLADHFFNQDPQSFFNLWSILKDEYPPVFWVSFWADLMWKAFHTSTLLEQKKFAEAKKMSYRLPNSFLQYGYKKSSPTTFVNLHNFLYSIDFALKQGSMFCSLDMFFIDYFNNTNKP